MTMKELAERCEKATGFDRDLEGAIHAAAVRDQETYWGPVYDKRVRNPIPHYTASLDAAMTLVPEGADVAWQSHGGPGPMALVTPNERFTRAATPALALCAAALRAIASQETTR
jgi:hypothetical protein